VWLMVRLASVLALALVLAVLILALALVPVLVVGVPPTVICWCTLRYLPCGRNWCARST
jgi:hypothetical protein